MLEDIEVFCTVARHKSFAKAARALHISSSVVTRRIVRLEQKLAIQLLHRTTRQVTLTEAGQIYYEEVSNILDALETSNKNIKSLNKEIMGNLKIGLPVSISHLHIVPQLHKFLEKFTNLKIHIINGNHLLDLLSDGFDLIVYCGDLPNSNFHYKKLATWEKIICAAPAYLAKHGIPKKLNDLMQHNCLDHAENFNFVWHLYDKNKPREIPVNGNVRVNSSIDLCKLAVSGLGLTYLPSFTVHHELKAGSLVSVLDNYRPPALNMYAVYPTSKYLNRKTQLFLEFIIEIFQDFK